MSPYQILSLNAFGNIYKSIDVNLNNQLSLKYSAILFNPQPKSITDLYACGLID